MKQQNKTQMMAAVVMCLFLVGAGAILPRLNDVRDELELTIKPIADEDVPPHIVLATTALGTFRGLAVDVLWHRMNELKQEGKYYEINKLADWITTLQPRFPQVWAFNAWNMSYNISVVTHTPEERWDWVNRGVNLLRGKGIPLNPNTPLLYKELSWIYFHKIAGFTDDQHWHYKSQIARENQEIFGYLSRHGTKEQVLERFKIIVDAPDTIEGVIDLDPEAARIVRLLEESGAVLDSNFAHMFGRYLMFTFSTEGNIMGLSQTRIPDGTDQDALTIIYESQRNNEAFFKYVVPHLRKRAIIESFHMDPQVMYEMMEDYGPIDWRNAASHGAYWSEMGVRANDRMLRNEEVDQTNLVRMRIHSFQYLFERGRVDYDPVTGRIDLLPDPRFVDAYANLYEEIFERIRSEEGLITMSGSKVSESGEGSFTQGYENFLIRAVKYCYLYGDEATAQRYFLLAREKFGEDSPGGLEWKYQGTVEDMVLSELDTVKDLTADVRQFIDGMIARGIDEGLAVHQPQTFLRYVKLARKMYDEQVEKAKEGRNPTAAQNRIGLGSWPMMLANGYIAYMEQPQMDLLKKARVWRGTPPSLQAVTWERLKPRLEAHVNAVNQSMGRDVLQFAVAFPAPDVDVDRTDIADTNADLVEGATGTVDRQ